MSRFNYEASSDNMGVDIRSLHEARTHNSSVFDKLWSSKLLKLLSDNKNLYDTLANKKTNITFPMSYLGSQMK